MPGTVSPPVAVGTLPFSLSTKFSESHAADYNGNNYADGSCQRGALVMGGRRRWVISKRLTIQNLETLRDFFLANRANAFYFYNPHETDPPFSHTPSGNAGRYVVRFNSDWEETIGIVRSDANLEIIELASATDIADASDGSGNNPNVTQPISYSLAVSAAWTSDFDHASNGIISPFGASGSFSSLPLLTSPTGWSTRTDTFQLLGLVDLGVLPLTTEAGIRSLQLFFYSSTYPQTLTNAGQQAAEFHVYDVALTVIYPDGTVRTFKPTTASLQDNGTAILTNAANAVDGDPGTFATLTAPAIGGLLWTLESPSPLVLTDFR